MTTNFRIPASPVVQYKRHRRAVRQTEISSVGTRGQQGVVGAAIRYRDVSPISGHQSPLLPQRYRIRQFRSGHDLSGSTRIHQRYQKDFLVPYKRYIKRLNHLCLNIHRLRIRSGLRIQVRLDLNAVIKFDTDAQYGKILFHLCPAPLYAE